MLSQQLNLTSHKESGSLAFRSGVGLLLALYLLVFLLPPGTVPHFHDEQALHSGEACKTDACHIAIYHPGDHNGCHHKFHFSKAPEECPFCHSVVTRYLPLQLASQVDFHFSDDTHYTSPAVSQGHDIVLHQSDRGPPFFLMA